MATIYLASFILSFPLSYYSRITQGRCYPHWPSSKAFLIFQIIFPVFTLILPLSITAVIYTIIIFHVNDSSRQHYHTYNKQRFAENKRFFRTMVCTFITFGLLNVPYAIFIIIYAIILADYPHLFYDNYSLMIWLNYGIFTMSVTNSCFNPIIYSRSDLREFRKQLIYPLVCFKKNQGKRGSISNTLETSVTMTRLVQL